MACKNVARDSAFSILLNLLVLSLPPVLLRKLTNLVHYTGKDSVLTVVFVFIKMVLVPSVVNCGDFSLLLVFFLFEGKRLIDYVKILGTTLMLRLLVNFH